MHSNSLRIFILLAIPIAISAIVKIDISPVKETNEPPETNVTTMLSTSAAVATEATTTTSASLPAMENTTTSSTQLPATNGSEAQQNNTVPINATMPTPIWDVTSLAHLPEFTIRMMRRKFTSYDYYCPCDLKVRSIIAIEMGIDNSEI